MNYHFVSYGEIPELDKRKKNCKTFLSKMATASPALSARIRDTGYINWLKVGLALHQMKTGLQEFVLKETESMHQSILQKLYEGPVVPFSRCDTCVFSDIIWDNTTWRLRGQCPSRLCDIWLKELLSFHQTQSTKNIPWMNSDVTAWPFNPWECAKIFMPRGQHHTDTGPGHCDAQALMSLMKNCTYFSRTLSPTGLHLISQVSIIRNDVMHACDMKFSERRMNDSMSIIIEFLEDPKHLKSLRSCNNAVSEIKKIWSLPVHVFFDLDLEEKSVGECLSYIRQQLGAHKEETEDTIRTIERTLLEINRKLDTHEETAISLQQQILGNRETLRRLEDNIIEANEAGKESKELRELKRSTENLLDSFTKMDFMMTKQVTAATNQLQTHNFVTLQGNPGEGKTTTALYLMDKFGECGRRVILKLPSEWKIIDVDLVDLVMIEDIFGRFDLDYNRLQEWSAFLEDIMRHLDAGKLKLIITTRVCILSEALSNLEMFKFFHSDQVQTLSSENLDYSEKLNFLEKELRSKSRKMNDGMKLKCVKNFDGLIGFPQCCCLFAGEDNLFTSGPEFFRQPEEFFTRNIQAYIGPRLLLFAFLFCNNGHFLEETVLTDAISEAIKKQLNDIAHALGVPECTSPIELIKKEIHNYSGTYIARSGPNIMFTHTTIHEAVGNVLGKQAKDIVIKYCSSDFLFQRLCTGEDGRSSRNQIHIPDSLHNLLAERIICEVITKNNFERVANTSFIRDRHFVIMLSKHLRDPRYGKSFLRKKDCILSSTSNKSQNGYCSNFLQHVLKRDSTVADIVFEHFLDFLLCNCGQIFSCWKCHENQNLLELSLYYGHFDIAEKLLERNTQLNTVCLCNAVRHSKLENIQSIIEELKEGGNFDLSDELIEESLCRAFVTGNQSVIDCLVKEGILLGHNSLEIVVREGNFRAFLDILQHLKLVGNWQPNEESEEEHICRSKLNDILCIAYMEEKFDIATILVGEGVPMYMSMLPKLVKSGSYKAVVRLIGHLKDNYVWDPLSIEAAQTMEIFSSECNDDRKKELFHLVVKKGIKPILKNVSFVVKHDPEYANELITNLKALGIWNSQADCASEALKEAVIGQKHAIFDLLIREGVSLMMQNLPDIVKEAQDKGIDMAIHDLKNNTRWDPQSEGVSHALELAFVLEKHDICHRLIREGITLQLESVSNVVVRTVSSAVIKKVVHHLKDNNEWEPRSYLVSEALEWAHVQEKSEVCNALVQEGARLTMHSLPNIVRRTRSVNAIFNVIKCLKEMNEWVCLSHNASEALREAIVQDKFDISGLLTEEGITLTMEDFPNIVMLASDSAIIETMHHLKETNKWNSQSDGASEALNLAFLTDKRDLCEHLIQERVPFTIKNLHDLLRRASDRVIIKIVEHLKRNNKWNPHGEDAYEALVQAFIHDKHDFMKFLIDAEGVSLPMEILPGVVVRTTYSVIVTVIAHLKGNGKWNANSHMASKALEEAVVCGKKDIYDLLIQEGLRLKMENLPNIVKKTSDKIIFQVVEHLKSCNTWNPNSDDARKAHYYAYVYMREDVCECFYNNGMKRKGNCILH